MKQKFRKSKPSLPYWTSNYYRGIIDKMNKLRKIFFPSKEEIDNFNKQLKEIEEEAIKEKHCIVCKHYSYNGDVPGFVTYEGDCDLKHTPFFGDISCIDWELKENNEIL